MRTKIVSVALAGSLGLKTLAETLPTHGGRGHHGPRGGRVTPEATAGVLGITVEELRTRLEAGDTLAQVAEAEGIARTALVSGLVEAAQAQLAADVTAGRLTQAQADEAAATLTERITEKVDRVGHGPGGRGHHRHDDDGSDSDDDTDADITPTTPGSTASANPSVGA